MNRRVEILEIQEFGDNNAQQDQTPITNTQWFFTYSLKTTANTRSAQLKQALTLILTLVSSSQHLNG